MQKDFNSADVFHTNVGSASTSSFVPVSASNDKHASAFVDQQAAKLVGKEQL